MRVNTIGTEIKIEDDLKKKLQLHGYHSKCDLHNIKGIKSQVKNHSREPEQFSSTAYDKPKIDRDSNLLFKTQIEKKPQPLSSCQILIKKLLKEKFNFNNGDNSHRKTPCFSCASPIIQRINACLSEANLKKNIGNTEEPTKLNLLRKLIRKNVTLKRNNGTASTKSLIGNSQKSDKNNEILHKSDIKKEIAHVQDEYFQVKMNPSGGPLKLFMEEQKKDQELKKYV